MLVSSKLAGVKIAGDQYWAMLANTKLVAMFSAHLRIEVFAEKSKSRKK